MRLTGLKRVENGLKSMQGLKLSFLKSYADQTTSGGPPEFMWILMRAAWPPQICKNVANSCLQLFSTSKPLANGFYQS